MFLFARRRRGPSAPRRLPPPAKKAKKAIVEEPSLFKTKVNKILKKVTDCTAGEFAVSGELKDTPLCVISIKNKGNLHFPLMEPEATTIIKAFEQSPFGRGTETIVDTAVRNSWQLSPKGFDVMNPKWNAYVSKTVIPQVGKDMGISTPFSASLYKLLLYKTGSFFKTHRDSEKETGMFATLVIQLPSKYKGGELVVTHDGKSKTFDFSSKGRTHKEFSCFYSAFYCDCEHEILRVTEGYRVCLIYNLLSSGADSIPVAPKTREYEEELIKLFEEWRNGQVLEPSKLVICFTHKYTEKNVSFNNLKTSDKAVAILLKDLADKCSMSLKLGFFEKDSQGVESNDYEFDSDDENCYAEKTYSLQKLICLDEKKRFPTLTNLPVEFEMEVIPPNCFDELEPYKRKRQDTGNEGVEVELNYRTTALVLWPENNILEVMQESSSNSTEVENLFLEEFKQNFKNKEEIIQKRLLKWAKRVSHCDSDSNNYCRSENIIPLFHAFIAFDNLELITGFMKCYFTLDNATIPLVVSQCDKYGWKTFSDLLVNNFARNQPNSYYQEMQLDEHAKSLKRLECFLSATENSFDDVKKEIFKEMFKFILESSKRCFVQKTTPISLYGEEMNGEQLKTMIEKSQHFYYSLCIDAAKLDVNLLEYSQEKRFDVVVPVLVKLAQGNNSSPGILYAQWMDIAKKFIANMEIVVAKAVNTPNWSRKEIWRCICKDCISVQAFLQSQLEYQRFPLGQKRCNHVLNYTGHGLAELKMEIERTGNTTTLVCTKTKKAFDAQCLVRNSCKELLPKLRAIIPNEP